MKLRSLPTAALFAGLLIASPFALSAAPAQAASPIDLSTLKISAEGAAETVEVNLNAALLSIAARITEGQDAEVSQLIKGLQQVQVRVFKGGEKTSESVLAQVEAVRAKLNGMGWQKAVSVRDAKGDNVDVHVNLRGDESIEGLVVTVLSGKGEIVLVNIVGSIRPEQLSKLGTRMNIEPLKNLNLGKPVAPAVPAVEPAVATETKG
jgi:hypothetical protein